MTAWRRLAAAAVLAMLAACTGVPDADVPRPDSIPPGRGLITGEKGGLVIGLPR
jgi:hypothetical protein